MQALRLFLLLSFLTGAVYPLMVTGIAQIFFKEKANGSVVYKDGKIIGSKWIAQEFKEDKYFMARPSSGNYNAFPSGASNKGPTSADLKVTVDQRKESLKEKFTIENNFPLDLIFASGSGLDPHISPNSTRLQIDKISLIRNFSVEQKLKLEQLVERMVEKRDWKILGEERVNVLLLNLELDKIK